jgi:hypothetical protein
MSLAVVRWLYDITVFQLEHLDPEHIRHRPNKRAATTLIIAMFFLMASAAIVAVDENEGPNMSAAAVMANPSEIPEKKSFSDSLLAKFYFDTFECDDYYIVCRQGGDCQPSRTTSPRRDACLRSQAQPPARWSQDLAGLPEAIVRLRAESAGSNCTARLEAVGYASEGSNPANEQTRSKRRADLVCRRMDEAPSGLTCIPVGRGVEALVPLAEEARRRVELFIRYDCAPKAGKGER